MGDGYIINRGNIEASGRLPTFKYTGKYELIDEGVSGEERNWKIKFLTSGEFTPAKDMNVAVRCVTKTTSTATYMEMLIARTVYAVKSGDVQPGETASFGDLTLKCMGSNPIVYIRNARDDDGSGGGGSDRIPL